MEARTQRHAGMQRAGGIAALYIGLAYLAAIPYFIVLVNYPSVVDPVQKVMLLRDNYSSMYLMHVVSFEFVALGLIIVTLAIYQRLKELAPSIAQVATVVGLIWAGLLLASVMVFNYGMGVVVRLYATDPDRAVAAWQALEPTAEALGGAGGELLGGVWMLLLSGAALRTKEFPRALSWLGIAIGIVGILSMVPTLNGLGVAFGLLQIVWFVWVGLIMLRGSENRTKRGLTGNAQPSVPLGA